MAAGITYPLLPDLYLTIVRTHMPFYAHLF